MKEYGGLNVATIKSMTRREIQDLIDGQVSRKAGYKESETTVKVDESDATQKKIDEAFRKRFGVDPNGRQK